MRDNTEATRRDEAMLMPGSAPRPGLRPPQTAARYGNTDDEREYAALEEQLGALAHDIARSRARLRETEEVGPRPGSRESPPAARGELVDLQDGGRILIRPVEPTDAPLIQAGFEQLAEVSRYRRFLTPIEHLSHRQLDYLARVDHHRHEALGAVDAATGEGVGIARYVCRSQCEADFAVAVADGWQGRGVGSALAERLAARARAEGVERLTARLLIGNTAGRRLLERVGEPIAEQRDGGTLRVTARLRR